MLPTSLPYAANHDHVTDYEYDTLTEYCFGSMKIRVNLMKENNFIFKLSRMFENVCYV